MAKYIVTVKLRALDADGIEAGDINTVHIPTIAKDEATAIKGAVVYHSDGGQAQENERLEMECKEPERGLVWIATRALRVRDDEWDIFLCVTDGLTDAKVCKTI